MTARQPAAEQLIHATRAAEQNNQTQHVRHKHSHTHKQGMQSFFFGFDAVHEHFTAAFPKAAAARYSALDTGRYASAAQHFTAALRGCAIQRTRHRQLYANAVQHFTNRLTPTARPLYLNRFQKAAARCMEPRIQKPGIKKERRHPTLCRHRRTREVTHANASVGSRLRDRPLKGVQRQGRSKTRRQAAQRRSKTMPLKDQAFQRQGRSKTRRSKARQRLQDAVAVATARRRACQAVNSEQPAAHDKPDSVCSVCMDCFAFATKLSISCVEHGYGSVLSPVTRCSACFFKVASFSKSSFAL